MPWYEGPTLLHHLEHVYIGVRPQPHRRALPGAVRDPADEPRPPRLPRLRGPGRERACSARATRWWCCRAASPPRSPASTVYGGPIEEAVPPMSVSVRLADDLDISRGDMLCPAPQRCRRSPRTSTRWCAGSATSRCARARPTCVKHTTRTAKARVQDLHYRLDVNTLHRDEAQQRARAQRARPGLAAHRGAAVRRRVPPQPHHRQLHPHRRGHVRDGRRGDDPRPVGRR